MWSGILDGGRKLWSSIFGNTENEQARKHQENLAAGKRFEAEWRAIQGRTWFDSLVDGINRLIRPSLVISVLALFWLVAVDPIQFAVVMQGMKLIPQELWAVLAAIVSFYLGTRNGVKRMTSVSPDKVEKVVANIERIRTLNEDKEPRRATATPRAKG
ncbi:MAG: hypothetical protein GDA50_00310 [Alphaproteobacteria bacterium GM202ARS2]|nr:hypothetical protein [Alphaproteobacteria bacterium GM202ARS2]